VTLARASGSSDSYVDIPFWVDSTVESLFLSASLQCMQTIYLYDPDRRSIEPRPASQGTTDAAGQGEDRWFRAGRIVTVLHPQPGGWVLRLIGTGAYFAAVQSKTESRMGDLRWEGNRLTVSLPASLDASAAAPIFRLVDAAGRPVDHPSFTADPEIAGRFVGLVRPPAAAFRVQAEWRTASGDVIVRTDPRLMPAVPVQ
jgi:hypothetical protein